MRRRLPDRKLRSSRLINSGEAEKVQQLAIDFGWLPKSADEQPKRNRERLEFEQKLTLLNMEIPWKDRL